METYQETLARHAAFDAEAEDFFGKSRVITNKIKPTVKRPTCARCGKIYGARHYTHTTVWLAVGDSIPPFTSNSLRLVEERLNVGGAMGPDAKPGARLERTAWDGTSYRGVGPFCTNSCAIKFALATYRDGYRIAKP